MKIEKILEYKIDNTNKSILGIKTTIDNRYGYASAIFNNTDIELMDKEVDLTKQHKMFQNLRLKIVYSLVDQVGVFAIAQGDFIMPTEESFINFNKQYMLDKFQP